MGNTNSGSGTYSLETNTFSITLNLSKKGKWLIMLKK
jgi:hypothetical protein